MSLALLFHYLLLNMFRMLVHPSSGTCEYLLSYFIGCIALVRCVLVLGCGLAGVVWCGIRMQNEEVHQSVTSVGLSLFNYQDDAARSDKHNL